MKGGQESLVPIVYLLFFFFFFFFFYTFIHSIFNMNIYLYSFYVIFDPASISNTEKTTIYALKH